MVAELRRKGEKWGVERWRAHVEGLLRARRLLWEMALRFPETRGLKAAHLKPWADAHTKLEVAFLRLEGVIVAHLGGEEAVPGGAIGFVRGRDEGRPTDPSDVTIGFVRGVSKAKEVLDRDTWIAWGRKAKEAARIVTDAGLDVQYAAGASPTSPYGRALDRVSAAIDRGRSRLDDLLVSQHRDWREFDRVFYGDPAPTD